MSIASDTARVLGKYPKAGIVKGTGKQIGSQGPINFWIESVEGARTVVIGFGPTIGKAWAHARKRITSGRDQ